MGLIKILTLFSSKYWRHGATSLLGLILGSSLASARVSAVYTVPTVSPDLAKAAKYWTRSDQNSYGSPDRTGLLRFSLPTQLTGLNTDFQMRRELDGSWAGTGTDGSQVEGQCSRENQTWFACEVVFTNLKFDALARESVLSSQFGRGRNFIRRQEVAMIFEGQPIGVIQIRIKKD
jgi:hypothetical protein